MEELLISLGSGASAEAANRRQFSAWRMSRRSGFLRFGGSAEWNAAPARISRLYLPRNLVGRTFSIEWVAGNQMPGTHSGVHQRAPHHLRQSGHLYKPGSEKIHPRNTLCSLIGLHSLLRGSWCFSLQRPFTSTSCLRALPLLLLVRLALRYFAIDRDCRLAFSPAVDCVRQVVSELNVDGANSA